MDSDDKWQNDNNCPKYEQHCRTKTTDDIYYWLEIST